MEDVNITTRGEEKKTGPAVERARRGVEAMEVVEETNSKEVRVVSRTEWWRRRGVAGQR